MCLTTVPIEFMDTTEFEREADPVFEDELPIRTKFILELSSGTKFGLDGGPMGITFGLESIKGELCRPERSVGGVAGGGVSGTTVLIVGASVGSTAISSSSENSGFSLRCRPCPGVLGSGSDDRLESSHNCDPVFPDSKM